MHRMKEIMIASLFTVFVLISEGVMTSELDYLRMLDDSISYRIEFMPYKDASSQENDSIFTVVSADNEKYQCVLPSIAENGRKRLLSYTGPSPAELVQSLYNENICTYRIEAYWYYELCHGRYLLQYHESKETKARTDYYLGNYAKIEAETEAKSFNQLNPPTRKIGDEYLAFYPVTYGHGSICDLTKKPRLTTVLYICDEEIKHQIYSLNEVSSCVYEVVVLTKALCAHPAFQKSPPKENEVRCYATTEDQVTKPKSLTEMENAASSQFLKEYGLFGGGSKVQSPKQLFTQLFHIESGDIDSGFEQINAILEALKIKASAKSQPAGQIPVKKQKSITTPDADIDSLEGFWSGKICLHGGDGWWRYELCYGRVITQYHDEIGKGRTSIVLGAYHDEEHKEWAANNPEKVVERGSDGRIMQVTNYYTKGDLCGQHGSQRSTEVRIRCRDELSKKIYIHVTEPATCLYALTVESSLFCKDLQDMDGRYGLPEEMPLPQSNSENDENERTSKSTSIRNDIESKAEGTGQIDDGPEEQENDNLGITSGDTRPPFEIQNLDRNQLFELVDLIQNEDVIFRKIVIEKRKEKEYKAYEASEAGSVEEEYDSDKENDKEQSESSEQKPIPPETQNT